jgi:DNA-binding ferritin-like protein (Dps family)
VIPETIIEAPQITAKEYEKYSGKDVAIYKNKIIADGKTSSEALRKALKKHPEAKTEEIEIFYIQLADVLIL